MIPNSSLGLCEDVPSMCHLYKYKGSAVSTRRLPAPVLHTVAELGQASLLSAICIGGSMLDDSEAICCVLPKCQHAIKCFFSFFSPL